MTRSKLLIGSVLGMCLVTTAITAQSTSSAPEKQNAGAPATKVTGCVERADQLGSTGAESSTVDSQHFMLVRAEPTSGKAPASVPKGTAGTLGPMYRLVVDAEKMNPHVGHKVELTGTADKLANAPASSTASSPSTAPTFKVQSIKMLAETCGR
jgi:hypothetical protein